MAAYDDPPLTHEEVERWVDEMPKTVLDRLPDNTEAREARRLHVIVGELAHDALERSADRR
jgi:hypothetical protein